MLACHSRFRSEGHSFVAAGAARAGTRAGAARGFEHNQHRALLQSVRGGGAALLAGRPAAVPADVQTLQERLLQECLPPRALANLQGAEFSPHLLVFDAYDRHFMNRLPGN